MESNGFERLSEIQKKLVVAKDHENKFGNYSYRKADDILNAIKSLLKKGESVMINDDVLMIGPHTYIKSTAQLIIGEKVFSANGFAREDESPKGNMSSPQSTGSASTYALKRALSNLFGISDGVDDDMTNDHSPNKVNSKKVSSNGVSVDAGFGEIVHKYPPIKGKTLNQAIKAGKKEEVLNYYKSQSQSEFIMKCVAYLEAN